PGPSAVDRSSASPRARGFAAQRRALPRARAGFFPRLERDWLSMPAPARAGNAALGVAFRVSTMTPFTSTRWHMEIQSEIAQILPNVFRLAATDPSFRALALTSAEAAIVGAGGRSGLASTIRFVESSELSGIVLPPLQPQETVDRATARSLCAPGN